MQIFFFLGGGGGKQDVLRGDVKMVNMLTTSLLYLFYYYFLILHFKNARSTFATISFDQCPFMNCFALLFSSLMQSALP